MKRFFILLATLFALCFNWTSCSDGSDGTGADGNSSSISLSKNELQFDSNSDYQTIKVTSSSDWSVSGGADWCDISPSSGKTGETVTISVDENTETDDRTVTFTFKCGEQTAQLTVLQYGLMETSYVDLKLEEEGTTVEYNEQTGETILKYKDGSTPTVEEGQAFVLDEEYGYDIRKITNVAKSNGKLVLQTEQGNMCDLFKNISFTLTTNPDLVAATRSAGRVITPASIKIVSNGEHKVIYEKPTSATRDASFSVPIKIFDLFVKEDAVSAEMKWDKWETNIGLDAVFQFDFGEKVSNQTKIGELKNFKYYMQGNVDIDLLLSLETQAEAFNYSIPEDKETIKKDVLPMLVVEFFAGPVPVIITLETDLKREGAITATGVVKSTAGFQLHADAKLGMEYDVRTKEVQPIKDFSGEYALTQPSYDIQASIEATAGYYPHLQFHFYKFVGPYLDIKPLFTAGLKAGMHYGFETKEEVFGWSAEFGTKIAGELGLELDWIFDDAKLKLLDVDLAKNTLFKAPASIKLESPKNGHPIKVGEETEVCFHVQAMNCITEDLYDCPKALVQYETRYQETEESEGEEEGKEEGNENGGKRSIRGRWENEKYVVADTNGRIKIKWGPSDSHEYLVANIINPDGETIASAEFKPEIEDKRRTLLEIIYKQTNGDNWTCKDNWMTDKPIKEWHGVEIDEETGQMSLHLNENNLTGEIDLDMTVDTLKAVAGLFKDINCADNQLTRIELLGHTELNNLECQRNPIELLDVGGCKMLKELDVKNFYDTTPTLTYLYAAACSSLENIECSRNKLLDLFIEGCTALKELHCNDNQLKELNLSGFSTLEILECENNPFETLDVSGCTALTNLTIHANGEQNPTLTSLNASGCTALEELDCSNNKLTTMLIDGCTAMKNLICAGNQLKVLDISNFKKLEYLYLQDNPWESINITECTVLTHIGGLHLQTAKLSVNISKCDNLSFIDFIDYNQIEHLDLILSDCKTIEEIEIWGVNSHFVKNLNIKLTNCPSLDVIYCPGNQLNKFSLSVSGKTALRSVNCVGNDLTDLELSGCSALEELWCYDNQITSLDVSGCSALTDLKCYDNQITSLDISGCSALEELWCYDNQITSLDASGCSALEVLSCSDNQITNLNISGCSALKYLYCRDNQICSVIPEWFSQLSSFDYDRRYTGYHWNDDHDMWNYTDNGVGWWYPGEPSKPDWLVDF